MCSPSYRRSACSAWHLLSRSEGGSCGMGWTRKVLIRALWVAAAIPPAIEGFEGCGGVASRQQGPAESRSAEGGVGSTEGGTEPSGDAAIAVDSAGHSPLGDIDSAEGASDEQGRVQCDAGAPRVTQDVCSIRASDYDRSCVSDSDCVLVQEGNVCAPDCGFLCSQAVINTCAAPAYMDALARAPTHSTANCSCPNMSPPCCRAGICRIGWDC
jgi:hypothetical protein